MVVQRRCFDIVGLKFGNEVNSLYSTKLIGGKGIRVYLWL